MFGKHLSIAIWAGCLISSGNIASKVSPSILASSSILKEQKKHLLFKKSKLKIHLFIYRILTSESSSKQHIMKH